MPRVRVAQPDQASIKAHPRAFVLYKQIGEDVDAQTLQEYIRVYGDSHKASSIGAGTSSLSFAEFSALFSRPAFPQAEGEGDCVGFAARDATGVIAPYRFSRRATGPNDVRLQISHAGICHSDLHQVRNEWKNATYPMVPGHEIVGYVTEVGSAVKQYKVGDRVGVGCMVNSCQECSWCVEKKEEQFCSKPVWTYNGTDVDGTPTQGGYSAFVTVNEKFVLRIPDNLPMDKAAPLLCAGITVYSPLRHYGLDKPGMKVGVAGLGGLGHMAVKIAAAMGVEVTVLSTSTSKKDEALNVLGAKHFLVTKDAEAMQAAFGSLDGIINTISAEHDLAALLSLLKVDGKMVCVGAPENPPKMPTMLCIFRRLTVAGSSIGGIRETQEMLDFCAQHGVLPHVEVVTGDYVNEAYERMLRNDVKYRFVIDIAKSIVC